MIFRASIIASLLFSIVACSSSSSSQGTTTSEASTKTIDGVCAKLGKLSCAQPNCVEKLTIARDRCTGPSDDFQGFLDCLSVATFTCDEYPRTSECKQDITRIDFCSQTPTTHPPTFDAGLPPGTCNDVSDCQSWPCSCADGTIVSRATCENNKCGDPIQVCSGDALESACKSHGGTGK